MTLPLLRITLGLLAVLLASAPVHAQNGPYGLEGASIDIAYADGTSGRSTVTLTPKNRIRTETILLTVSDGRRDYPVRLRATRDGTFTGRAELPEGTEFQVIRFGDPSDARVAGAGRAETRQPEAGGAIRIPELRKDRDGNLSGGLRTNGWSLEISIGDDGIEIVFKF